ncbi:hypothetical protein DH2020_015466 [Rehmannia glutinosa]|uniref:Uncharacterized protein n=1 Tax=Rehmannia glutinosa TaxID=99300 RepID=A0ABR0WTR0_REHGL
MAASSLPSFTLSFHHYMNQTPKFSHPVNLNPFKNHILNSPSSHFQQTVSRPQITSTPISKPSILAFLSPPQKKISNFFVENIAAVLLGSLIFMGCLKSRPVLAQPVQVSEGLNENSDSEEELMCVKLLQEDPKNIEALKMVVNVKMRRGKTGEAVEYVEKLIDLQPNEMEWRLLQALCYEMMGNLSKAKSLFKNILKQKPLLLRALHFWLRIYCTRGGLENSLSCVDGCCKSLVFKEILVFFYKDISSSILHLLPDDSHVHVRVVVCVSLVLFTTLHDQPAGEGLAMVMHKNHEGLAVFEMLERALEVAHRQKRVNEERNIRILIAQMHIIKGDLVEALEKFQALIDENPRDFRPYLCQGIVYSLLEKRKEAEENFEIYRSLVPEEFPQRGFLDDVVLAAKSDSKQQLEKELQS